jgi:hypothetical protein
MESFSKDFPKFTKGSLYSPHKALKGCARSLAALLLAKGLLVPVAKSPNFLRKSFVPLDISFGISLTDLLFADAIYFIT